MSRQFDAVDDVVTFDAGAATGPQGPITIAALIKPTMVSGTRCIVEGNTATDAGYGLLIDSGSYYTERMFTSPQTADVGEWQWAVFTKASGSVAPRWHYRNVTDAGAWVHTDAASSSSDGPSPVTHIRVGQSEFFTGRFAGSVAAVAVWGTVLSDGAVEAACTLAAADLAAASPAWGTLWGQASEATPVEDFTGGGGDQVSIVGTAVDPDDPPGWSYALLPPASEVTLTPATLTLTAVPVTAVPGPVTVTLTPAVLTLLAVALVLSAEEPGTLVASGRPASTLTSSGSSPALTAAGTSSSTLTASGRP